MKRRNVADPEEIIPIETDESAWRDEHASQIEGAASGEKYEDLFSPGKGVVENNLFGEQQAGQPVEACPKPAYPGQEWMGGGCFVHNNNYL